MDDQSSMEQSFLKKLHRAIEENFENEHFGVDELAHEIGLSRSQLHRKLQNINQDSASQMIRDYRLQKALEMLQNRVATVSEISYRVGFSSPSYFNTCFHEYFGYSPGKVKSKKSSKIHQTNKSFRKVLFNSLAIILIIVAGLYSFILSQKQVDIPAGQPSKVSIAILPFDNLSSNEETRYFADGIVEDLLTRLSTLNNLKVTSRTSSEMFRDKGNHTIPEIGEILGVAYILEGTVQQESDNLRISVQLIDAKNDDHVLSKQYDRNLNDFFIVQREIAGEIASELSPVLTDQQLEKLKHDNTQNIKALQLYQIGRFHSSKRTTEEFIKGIEYYKKAVKEDPGYALAYAGLADNYHLMSIQGRMDFSEADSLAREMAEMALEIDPDLAEAYTVLGSISTYVEEDWVDAEKEFLKAIELNPNYSTAHQYYAEYLTIMGRDEEARKHQDKAIQLDPFSFVVRWRSARMYYDQEQFDQALSEILVCLDLNAEHPWALNLGYDIYLALEDDSAAVACIKRFGIIDDLWTPELIDSLYQKGGIDEITKWGINHTPKGVEEYRLAIYYAMLREYEKTMDLLELAMDAGKLAPMRTTEREYKPLRSNPRFIAIREKMDLPPLKP